VTSLSIEIALIVLLVLVNGVLAGSELAIVSARRHRLQQRADAGDGGARTALEMASQPNRFLSTVQVGITGVGIFAGAFGGATLAEQLAGRLEDGGMGEGLANALGVGGVVLAITYLSLVFGELVPKRVALQHPERIASVMSRPLHGLAVAGRPLVAILSSSTEAVLRIFRIHTGEPRSITEEELRMLLLEGSREGIIEAGEQRLASAALQLGDRTVSDVMTPRLDVTWLDLEDGTAASIARVTSSPHHWFPVIEGGPDRVLGAVAVRDLFRAAAQGKAPDLRASLLPVAFVPESQSLLLALEQMRGEDVPLAVVVDEYGGTSGIVTVTDVVETVVGDFAPEGEPEIVILEDGGWSVDGRVQLGELSSLPDPPTMSESADYQTLAGFVLHRLGRIPAVGDSFEFQGWRFEVVDMDARRVDRVIIRRL
jgi:putative hemolysin